ncbi:SDR family NAD(P)-dependent oxidoreductase [Bradyrhizobium japonicum]
MELDLGRQPDGDHLGHRDFRPLIEQHGEGGHIVSTASIAGLISGESNAYNVSKYGVVALSEGLRRELAPRGIGVSVLCPGVIRTQIMNSRRNLPKRFEGGSLPCRLQAHVPSGSICSGSASLRA